MDNKQPVYPNIDFKTKTIREDNGDIMHHCSISTWVRKKHTDGLWYKQFFYNWERSPNLESIGQCFTSFSDNLYLNQLFGKILPELEEFYVLDEDQRSEEERLNSLRILRVKQV